jgi:hypothetical protein
MNLYRYSNLLEIVPFEQAAALDNVVIRWLSLPTVGSRKLNAGYTESTGKVEQMVETVRPIGGDVDVEKVLDDLPNVIEKPSVTQLAMKAKAMAYLFNHLFINGSESEDPDAFYGIKHRVGLLAEKHSDLEFAIGSAGTPYDVLADSASEHTFIDKLHRMNALVGGADCYLCNFDMRLGFGRVLRRVGLLDTSRDAFDREVYEFNGAPIIDVGVKADQSTEIITDTEDPGDGGSDTTSIYAVNFGQPEGLVGVQLTDLQAYLVSDELEAKPTRRWRIDWFVGLAGFGDMYIAHMYNLKPASGWT